MVQRIAILGAGSWGTALATLLHGRESVRLWARSPALAEAIQSARENARYLPQIRVPDCVCATASLEVALAGAEAVILAVPSSGMGETMELAGPHLQEAELVVSASKGLEDTTGRRMSQVIAAAVNGMDRVAALSGPNLALEVARGIPTASVAAATRAEVAQACQGLWMGPTFRVYTSPDLIGVELAGAMKNVIAIAAGICEGLGYGDNSRAALMTRGLAEITRLGAALGAQPATFLGLAGVGALIATGGSRLSRNYRVGVGVGAGRPLGDVLAEIGQVAEGIPTTRAICTLARRVDVEMPIAESLHRVLFENAYVRDALSALMLRPPRNEADL